MKTFPIPTLSLEQAIDYQFKLVDVISQHFSGTAFLNMGDLGVIKSPHTQKVEATLAQFFGAEDAVLIRGAGTGAIRWSLFATIPPQGKLLVHDAPIYPTTKTTLESMGITPVVKDFHDLSSSIPKTDAVLIQYARQKGDDSYDMATVIKNIKEKTGLPIVCDDNYLVMKVEKISTALGADLSAFSLFKLQGPPGLGCIVGKKAYVQKIKDVQYSGGSQVQGSEAMEALRSLVYTPVLLALQSQTVDACCEKLQTGIFPFVKNAYVANAQSKVLLVEFKENIAKKILVETEKLGGLPHPVGAESKYETLPLFYRVSGTFLKADPSLEERMIRINPNRAGIETVFRILESAYKKVID